MPSRTYRTAPAYGKVRGSRRFRSKRGRLPAEPRYCGDIQHRHRRRRAADAILAPRVTGNVITFNGNAIEMSGAKTRKHRRAIPPFRVARRPRTTGDNCITRSARRRGTAIRRGPSEGSEASDCRIHSRLPNLRGGSPVDAAEHSGRRPYRRRRSSDTWCPDGRYISPGPTTPMRRGKSYERALPGLIDRESRRVVTRSAEQMLNSEQQASAPTTRRGGSTNLARITATPKRHTPARLRSSGGYRPPPRALASPECGGDATSRHSRMRSARATELGEHQRLRAA